MVGPKKQEFWPRINIMKGKIKNLPMNASSSKIEHDFNKKSGSKIDTRKNVFSKNIDILKRKKNPSIFAIKN